MPAARAPERWQPMAVIAAGVEYNAFSFDGHVHTNHSHDARHPPVEVLGRASMSGLDAVVITDHGTTAARSRVAGYGGRVLFISGEEIGGPYGHTVAWNFRARQKILVARNAISTLARAVHAEGGLLVLAHPGWWITGLARNPMNWISADALRRFCGVVMSSPQFVLGGLPGRGGDAPRLSLPGDGYDDACAKIVAAAVPGWTVTCAPGALSATPAPKRHARAVVRRL